MSRYVLSPQAQKDLLDITDYVASDNLSAAFRLRDRFFGTFRKLAAMPAMGHFREDLVSREAGIRFWTLGAYLIVYRGEKGRAIEIVRVLSGYRDIKTILSDLD